MKEKFGVLSLIDLEIQYETSNQNSEYCHHVEKMIIKTE